MVYISDEEIKALNIDSQTMLDWVNDTLSHKLDCKLPPKISIKMDGHVFYNTMPCVIPYLNVAGLKCVNRYPDNTPSLHADIMIYDLETGHLKAILDGNYITTWRTAAVAVHSMYLLAKKDFNIISFIGLGEVGRATLKILCDTIQRNVIIRIFNYKNRAQEIISKFNTNSNIRWEIFDKFEEMAKDSDVIFSAVTYAEEDFLNESKYKKGCLLIPIHTLGFQGCDLSFDKIFGDDYNHIKGFKYFDKFKSFNETSDVINKKCIGRQSDEERIIAYNIGIALHDIAFANNIYNLVYKK